MTEKDIDEAIRQIEKWQEEDTDNRAVICLQFDRKTNSGTSYIAGSHKNLLGFLIAVACKNEQFRKMIKDVTTILDKYNQTIEPFVHFENDEGNINIS